MSVISMSAEDEHHLFGTVEPTKGIWYPIETSPEMTDILVYSSDRRQAVAYCDLTDMDGFYDEPIRIWNVGGLFLSGDTSFQPTHWMPLPEEPK